MVKAARVQPARTRDLVAQIGRQVAAYDAGRPERVARDQRIQSGKRDARRALRARASAEQARRKADAEAAAAVRRLLGEGLSLSDAAILLALSRSAAKRLARLGSTSTGSATALPSTGEVAGRAVGDESVHGQNSRPAFSGATNEGKN